MADYHPKCVTIGSDRKLWSVAGKGLNIPVDNQDAAQRLATDLNAAAQVQRHTTGSMTILVISLALSASIVIGAAIMHAYK